MCGMEFEEKLLEGRVAERQSNPSRDEEDEAPWKRRCRYEQKYRGQ